MGWKEVREEIKQRGVREGGEESERARERKLYIS
jgi:hypothetical protein